MVNGGKVGTVVGVIFGAAGLIASAVTYYKTSKMATNINVAVSELSSNTPITIKEAIIDKAVRDAVNREVGLAVSLAANDAVKKISSEMETQIRKPVSESYSNIEKSVSTEIARQVEKLDIEVLKRDVIEKAKVAVAAKLDDSLDAIIKGFNDNMENVAKVYGAVASSMAKKQEKGFLFRFD